MIRQYLDIPPVWLLLCLAIAWAQKTYYPMGLSFGSGFAGFLGGVLAGGGILLMLLAVWEMRRHKTTVMPHRYADTMVTTGIYSRTRNPIYLGDVMVLGGMIIFWGAVLSLPLIPIFVWWIERHFIAEEEGFLREKFRADFARYAEKTRRWL